MANALETALDVFIRTGGVQRTGNVLNERRERNRAREEQEALIGALQNDVFFSSMFGRQAVPGVTDQPVGGLGGNGQNASQTLDILARNPEARNSLFLGNIFRYATDPQFGDSGKTFAQFALSQSDKFLGDASAAKNEINGVVNSVLNTFASTNSRETALQQLQQSRNLVSSAARGTINNILLSEDPLLAARTVRGVLGGAEDVRQSALNREEAIIQGEIDQRRKETPQPLSEQDRLAIDRTRLEIAQIQQKIDADTQKTKEAKDKEKKQVSTLISGIDNTLGTIDRALEQSKGFAATGLLGAAASNIPTTPAANLQRTVDTVKANIGLDKIQEMRRLSPTGGALGNVSNFELDALQSVIASLDISQPRDVLQNNLNIVRDHYGNWKLTLLEINPRDIENGVPIRIAVEPGLADAQFNALPSGTIYIDPDDGLRYRKP